MGNAISSFLFGAFALMTIVTIIVRSWGRSYEAREFRQALQRALNYRTRPMPFVAITVIAWALMFLVMACLAQR
jgi:hypothetical protein